MATYKERNCICKHWERFLSSSKWGKLFSKSHSFVFAYTFLFFPPLPTCFSFSHCKNSYSGFSTVMTVEVSGKLFVMSGIHGEGIIYENNYLQTYHDFISILLLTQNISKKWSFYRLQIISNSGHIKLSWMY